MANYDSQWIAPQRPENWQMSNYGLNVGQMGGAATNKSAWATGDAGIDQYIGALDSALKGGRVGGAAQMARDLEAARRFSAANSMGGPPQLTMPDFGSSFGGGAGGGATLRANPYEARLNSLLDNPDSIANTAGYKFEMDQGQQALARSAAAKGMTGSGNTLAALLEHGQGLAATRRGQEVDRLSSLVHGRDSVNANLYGTDVGANTSRYNTDVGSKTSMWNTAQKINADNYWNAQKMAENSAPQYGRPVAGSSSTLNLSGGFVPTQLAPNGGGGGYRGGANSLSSLAAPVRQSEPTYNMTWGQAQAFNNAQRRG